MLCRRQPSCLKGHHAQAARCERTKILSSQLQENPTYIQSCLPFLRKQYLGTAAMPDSERGWHVGICIEQ
eukprot:6173168-Pleurochrysis_carterae.AAC.2